MLSFFWYNVYAYFSNTIKQTNKLISILSELTRISNYHALENAWCKWFGLKANKWFGVFLWGWGGGGGDWLAERIGGI